MPRPKRSILATYASTSLPPASLSPTQILVRVIKAEGKNLYTVSTPAGETLLVELPARFRSTIWIRNGGYVLVDTARFEERENKLGGEIENVVREERAWRKMSYWPKEFGARKAIVGDTEDEDDSEEGQESNMGKMPPEAEESGEEEGEEKGDRYLSG